MMSDLESLLERIVSEWAVLEDSTTLTIQKDNCTSAECGQIIEQVGELRDFIDGRSLIFTIRDTRDIFEYRLQWERTNSIVSISESDSGTGAGNIFAEQSQVTALEKIRDGRIHDLSTLSNCLGEFTDDSQVEVSFTYRIDTQNLADVIGSELEVDYNTSFYFQKDTFLSTLDSLQLEETKEIFSPKNGKRLFVIQNLDGYLYGENLAFFNLSVLESEEFQEFKALLSNIDEVKNRIGRECVIDDFENTFLPPDFFEFRYIANEEFHESFRNRICGIQLMFALFSVCNVVRNLGGSWEVRINGKKLLGAKITLVKDNQNWILREFKSKDEYDDFELTRDTIEAFVDLFKWSYEVRTTDRISVLRNIITLYTTTIKGLLSEVDEIHDSTERNFKFYAEESVDEFIDLQQEVSNYLLETQRQFSDLRRNLTNNLSRDLFRVFTFVIVSWVGIFLRIEKIATIRTAITVSLVPVIIYLALSLWSVYGLNEQYQSLETNRKAYYEMYKSRIDENLLEEITVGQNNEDKISGHFEIDKWIHYILISTLLALAVYTILDLQLIGGPISDHIQSFVASNSSTT